MKTTALSFYVLLWVSSSWALNPREQSWFPKAPALPPAEGSIVIVSDAQSLVGALREAQPGHTILVEDGHYMMPRYVQIDKDNVTLRGASGHRDYPQTLLVA